MLWAGMPLSLLSGALTMAAETGITYAVGFGVDELPLYNLRFLIGAAAACLAWAKCLQISSRHQNPRPPRNRVLPLFVVLFLGVIFAHGLSLLIKRTTQKDVYFLLASIIETTISAAIVMFVSQNPLLAS